MPSTETTPIRIVVDSREQLPWQFRSVTVAARRKLEAGDYSIDGMETRIALERKSLDDLVGTLTRERDRFRRELEKLNAMEFARVVVESSPDAVLAGGYRSTIPGGALLEIVAELEMEFPKVPFTWCGSRTSATRYAELLFRRFVGRFSLA